MLNKLLAILLLTAVVLSAFLSAKNARLQEDIQQQESLIGALSDSVSYTRDKYDREVASKQAIVADMDVLKQTNDRLLTENQRLLKKAVTESKKEPVAAVQLKERVVVRVDTVMVAGDSLVLDNNKTILFTEDKKTVRVQVTNSNPNFKTLDVDAIYKKKKPPFYQRGWFKVAVFVGGVVTGVALSR